MLKSVPKKGKADIRPGPPRGRAVRRPAALTGREGKAPESRPQGLDTDKTKKFVEETVLGTVQTTEKKKKRYNNEEFDPGSG